MRRGVSDSVVIAIVLGLVLVAAPVAYNLTRPAGPVPSPVVVPIESHPLAQFRGNPLTKEVGQATKDFATVLKAFPVATTREFKANLMAFYDGVFMEQRGAIPGFSAAFETAFVRAFGDEDGPLDQAKAQAFLLAASAALGVP